MRAGVNAKMTNIQPIFTHRFQPSRHKRHKIELSPTLPSDVQAANTVDENGAQAASPTLAPKSKFIMARAVLASHTLTVQSAEQERKTRGWKRFQPIE